MTFQKKEGSGAFSALSTLFGKKNSPQGTTAPDDDIPVSVEKNTAPAEPIPAASPKNGITYSEVGAGEQLGIDAEDVGWFRRAVLALGKDYTRDEGFIRINAAGVAKIRTRLDAGDLICTAASLPNPKLVLARRPGGTKVLRVRVADSSSWCKGMIMPDCGWTDQVDVFVCEARPRTKGRL
jgi:hypothetical protein